jgi:hypothetical protein
MILALVEDVRDLYLLSSSKDRGILTSRQGRCTIEAYRMGAIRRKPGGISRLLKNAHLRRFPHPSSLRRTGMYASFLGISGALDLDVFEPPVNSDFQQPVRGQYFL